MALSTVDPRNLIWTYPALARCFTDRFQSRRSTDLAIAGGMPQWLLITNSRQEEVSAWPYDSTLNYPWDPYGKGMSPEGSAIPALVFRTEHSAILAVKL